MYVDENQIQKLLDAYYDNQEDLANYDTLDYPESQYDEGYGNALEYVFEVLKIKH